jgi:hypothetical protein
VEIVFGMKLWCERLLLVATVVQSEAEGDPVGSRGTIDCIAEQSVCETLFCTQQVTHVLVSDLLQWQH